MVYLLSVKNTSMYSKSPKKIKIFSYCKAMKLDIIRTTKIE